MYQQVSKLLLYRSCAEDSILSGLCRLFRNREEKRENIYALRSRLHMEVNRLLQLSQDNGWEGNLWHCYLTWLLITDENPFSLACERREAPSGTLSQLAKRDLEIFAELFLFDFSEIETDLQTDCFTLLSHWENHQSDHSVKNMGNRNTLCALSGSMAHAGKGAEMFRILTAYYKTEGVGKFAMNTAFRIKDGDDSTDLIPVKDIGAVSFDDLIGYERQRDILLANTRALLAGKPSNHVLLYGDSGTGKSTGIRALLRECGSEGLRMIEIYKHQFCRLSRIIGLIGHRNYGFIIYIDDLSFEENEFEYKYFKAIMEGGIEAIPENVRIYATSNRRHIVKEMWQDKEDMEYSGEVHRSDTMEEKLSLAARFGVLVNYSAPNRQEFLQIVAGLADRQGITMDHEQLFFEANRWEIRHGGLSGRTAKQFLNDLMTREPSKK